LPGQGSHAVPVAIRQWLGIYQQEFITPYSPEQNGMVERGVIRTSKDKCVHRHGFEAVQHANQVVGDLIGFYNHARPHYALGMRTPAEVCALAA
jgi:putative transposase